MIDRRTFLAGTGAVLLATPLAAQAQQAPKLPWIGFLRDGSAAAAPWVEAFRKELRERGWLEGQNVAIE